MKSVTVEIDATYTMNLIDRIRSHIAKTKIHGVPAEYFEEEWELLMEMVHLSLRLIGATAKPQKIGAAQEMKQLEEHFKKKLSDNE